MPIAKSARVKAIPFTKQLGFRTTVTQRVETYLKDNGHPLRDVPEMHRKTVAIFAWYGLTWLTLIVGNAVWGLPTWLNFALYVVFGFAMAGVGFNVMHDALHGGYSSHARKNKILGWTMELIGSSSMQWKHKHNVLHHTYTNVAGMDEDLETQGILRLTPHDEWKPWFRAQAFYLPFAYALTGFGFLVRDFRVYFTGKSDEWHVYPKMTREDKITFWAGKLVFAMLTLIVPLMILPWWQAVLGFFVLFFTTGLTLAAIFQLAHVMDDAAFPEPSVDPIRLENEWAIHQVETTVNYSPRNTVLNWYAGGLNYQIEHHLFPHICHVHYPRIAHIVQATCQEFGVKYNVCETYGDALASHWRKVAELARPPVALAG
jgi:linoleoyl-CoA desaturase